MTNEDKRALLALPLILLLAAGMAWAGSQGGSTVAGIPLFALSFAVAFFIQWLAFIPAFLRQTEVFYDLTGSLTYLTVILLAMLLSPEPDARSWLLAVLVLVWSARLGTFLFTRIRRAGEDRRFREIKRSFARFLLAWTLQGLWVCLCLAAALAAITSTTRIGLDLFAAAGMLFWLIGFGIEVIADRQKRDFNANPAHKSQFIRSGLWSWSRHPNYFGEIVLWTGIALIALPVLRGWQYATLISPVFVIILLTRISGIPMLESRADEKWGGQPDYEAYKANTPILIPRPPTKR